MKSNENIETQIYLFSFHLRKHFYLTIKFYISFINMLYKNTSLFNFLEIVINVFPLSSHKIPV